MFLLEGTGKDRGSSRASSDHDRGVGGKFGRWESSLSIEPSLKDWLKLIDFLKEINARHGGMPIAFLLLLPIFRSWFGGRWGVDDLVRQLFDLDIAEVRHALGIVSLQGDRAVERRRSSRPFLRMGLASSVYWTTGLPLILTVICLPLTIR